MQTRWFSSSLAPVMWFSCAYQIAMLAIQWWRGRVEDVSFIGELIASGSWADRAMPLAILGVLAWVLIDIALHAHRAWREQNGVAAFRTALATRSSRRFAEGVPVSRARRRAEIIAAHAELLTRYFYEDYLSGHRSIERVVRSLAGVWRSTHGLVVLQRGNEGVTLNYRQASQAVGPDREPQGPTGKVKREQPGKKDSEGAAEQLSGAAAQGQPAPGGLARVPGGPFKTGLTSTQIESVIQQMKAIGVDLDWSSVRATLSQEAVEVRELAEYWIDATPVMNEQFASFIRATRYVTTAEQADDRESWRSYYSGRGDHPVVCVSFDDALRYAQWAGQRLPTADEWKKAYRGPDGRLYPWGDKFNYDRCNTAENCAGHQTTPVTRFPEGRSFYGCYDMLGNVEEWTSSDNGKGQRLVFGGSWKMSCQIYGLPVLHRVADPTSYFSDTGFRCVR